MVVSGLGAFDNPFLTQGPSIIIAYATCVDWGHRAGDKAMVQQQARADGIHEHGFIEGILQGLFYVYLGSDDIPPVCVMLKVDTLQKPCCATMMYNHWQSGL